MVAKNKFKIKNIVPNRLAGVSDVNALVEAFLGTLEPLEASHLVHVLVDARTKARYCECHIPASKLVPLSTTDVPLDPEDQPEYRANREIVTSHYAFEKMQQDAKERRSFSNLVTEFTTEYDPDHPLKIIGGQHRYEAIKEAQATGVDEYHGVKVYFGLDSEQRLDVQLISNTVIAVSADLYDRMQETVRGPELRDWCQKVGLLAAGQDFADKRQRGGAFTVRNARTFIVNYYAGVDASGGDFAKTDTTPTIAKSGEEDKQWEAVRNRKPSIWKDAKLEKAGTEFSALIKAQREAFKGTKGNADSPSDVLEEREAAVRVMQDWNDLHSNNRRVVILPLRWETHTAPEYNVRPQEVINRRIVDDCDLLVGIFWTRLGKPTGEADSGTLEEIERVAKAGKPVMLYFSHVPVDPNRVDLKQLEQLMGFRDRILASALVETFGSSLDFRDKFANQLERKIRDLQKADELGQPLPLSLQFISPQTKELTGSSLLANADLLQLADVDGQVNGELKQYFDRVFQDLCAEAAMVPVALTIKNTGSAGIRNLYVEMTIKALDGDFRVSDSDPLRRHRFEDFIVSWSSGAESSEIERNLEKLSGKGLRKERDEWKFSFEWEALQPQRVRLIQPFTFLQVSNQCRAEFSAKVYADSFASPIVLHAQLVVEVRPKPIQNEIIVAKAKELMESANRTSGYSFGSSWSRSTTAELLASDDRVVDKKK